MTAAAKEEKEFCLFIGRDIDDYGLDVYEFRLFACINRRAGSRKTGAIVGNKTSICCKSFSNIASALKLARWLKSSCLDFTNPAIFCCLPALSQ